MSKRLIGKVAIITGAARGIGAAHVEIFAQEGAQVVACDVLDERGEALVSQVKAAGGSAIYRSMDVSKATAWQAIIAETVQQFGCLTSLVNNAGIYNKEGVDDETEEGWDRVLNVNLKGEWLGMKYAIPEMIKAGGGSVVNIGSYLGVHGDADGIAYHCAKAGVRMLTKSAALRFAKDNVRVNVIHPSMIRTEIVDTVDPALVKMYEAQMPSGKWGKSADIAYGSLYLCSDEAQYVTGAELNIDGGLAAR